MLGSTERSRYHSYLEQSENKLPSNLPVPTEQGVEILLNVTNEYDFFVIGKKHNKVTYFQNNEHVIDHIRQVRKADKHWHGRCVQVKMRGVWPR